MNADYIKQVVDKANELITLIYQSAANPNLSEEKFEEWKNWKETAIESIKQGVSEAIASETIN